MAKILFVLATVLFVSVFITGQQVKPNTEIGRVTVQVPLLSNGKPVMTQDNKDMVEVAEVVEIQPDKMKDEAVVVPLAKVRTVRADPVTEKPAMPVPVVGNPVAPKPGMTNSTVEVQHVVATPAVSTVATPAVVMKAAKSCHQLLVASAVELPTPMPVPNTPVENCEMLCTKFELMPICAYNGVCVHEFPNQCVLDTFNCKHRDLAFRAVDEDICMMGVCSRRCNDEDLKM